MAHYVSPSVVFLVIVVYITMMVNGGQTDDEVPNLLGSKDIATNFRDISERTKRVMNQVLNGMQRAQKQAQEVAKRAFNTISNRASGTKKSNESVSSSSVSIVNPDGSVTRKSMVSFSDTNGTIVKTTTN